MGHQEPPLPHQRHRVPHHRRRRHHHQHHHSAAPTANDRSDVSLGRLNREYHAPDSHGIVESWLGQQFAAPVPTSRLVSLEPQNQSLHRRKRQRSKDRDSDACGRSSRRVDPSWRPQHIPPARGSSPPRLPLLTNREANLKRYKRNGDDSSLISDPDPHHHPRALGFADLDPGYDEDSRYQVQEEAEVDTADASSQMSRESVEPAFEKRSRHKTKADKYDTKKNERHEKKGGEGKHRARKSKSSRKRPIVIGKNVMKNFNSGAVVNDRITTTLRPGLFENKRVPRNNRVTDLSFSDMPYPTHQKRDAPQQKGPSTSQLKERRRESRELEQVSSFFQPCADAKAIKKQQARLRNQKERGNQTLDYNTVKTTPGFYQDSFGTPSSPVPPEDYQRRRSLTSMETSVVPPTATAATPSTARCRPSSDGNTTYFTWSTSHHSPQPRHKEWTQSRSVESARSETPETIRKAMVATGVYNNSGIGALDIEFESRNCVSEMRGNSSSANSNAPQRAEVREDEDSILHPTSPDRTGAISPYLTQLSARWNTILPPEWRIQKASEPEVTFEKQQPVIVPSDMTAQTLLPIDRQEMIDQARIKPQRGNQQDRHAYSARNQGTETSQYLAPQNLLHVPPREIEQIPNHTTSAGQGRTTVSSTDAMPPPPIPPTRSDHSGASILKPEANVDASRPLASSNEPRDKPDNCQNPQVMDTNRRVGQPRESSREPERMISTLDSASWIPQAVTSNITSYEREMTLSRLSMRSPLYEVSPLYGLQDEDENPKVHSAPPPPPPPPTHRTESMADFILRIESEMEEPTALDELPVCSQMDGGQLIIDNPDFDLAGIVGSNGMYHECDDFVAPIEDITTASSAAGPIDDVDESLEMSSFWRPNRFAYF
ncbi:hypothetical protein F4808DRAFT_471866 [Astrocystis sublimbata]|nr:hypothetical protein F4808DRAFT_471866 [Astrocystis sublimbata]